MNFHLLVAIGAALAFVGCGTRCTPGVTVPHCDGNTLVFCPTPHVDYQGPIVLEHKDCEDNVCMVVAGRGVCVLSATPEPACDGGGGALCESSTSGLLCFAGFAIGRELDGDLLCTGSPGEGCTQDSDCAPGSTCPGGHCQLR